ncbi:RhoGAP-domain-containing protein [Meredithblackwellia eburnea MCA 4105]
MSTISRPLPTPPQHPPSPSPEQPTTAAAGAGAGAGVGAGQVASTLTTAPAGEAVICCGCGHLLSESGDSVVVSFGSSLWHVDCFRCAKCHNLVEHDTNLLLLSDGSPVCENCSYICSVCLKAISNEAIVTGDESYHADCFRCRSCANKIEELIFAKTSQGIWCMSCHNDRVTRSRKHAEAKRNKTVKREKEGSSGSSSGKREREKSARERERSLGGAGGATPTSAASAAVGQTSAPLTASSEISFDVPDVDPQSQSSPRPLPPSPFASTTSDTPGGGVVLNEPTPSSPSRLTNGRNRFPSESGPSPSPSSDGTGLVPSSPSNTNSLANRTMLPSSPSHSRHPSQNTTLSAAPSATGDMDRSLSQTSLNSDPAGTVIVSRIAGPGDSHHSEKPSSPFSEGVVSPEGVVEHVVVNGNIGNGNGNVGEQASLPTSRQGSLSAPDKAANRRSGFYGAARRPSADGSETGTIVSSSNPPTGGGGGDTISLSSTSSSIAPSTTTTVRSNGSSTTTGSTGTAATSFLPELHHSMSFYDPDTLLFLDHVGSDGGSPPTTHLPRASGGESLAGGGMGGIVDVPGDQVEHLSPEIGSGSGGTGGEEDEDEDDELPEGGVKAGGAGGGAGRRPPKSEVASKVRESIRKSREGDGMSMDVELVEMLLAELDSTKKEMQDLQGRYNAFRRASRSAFEGFSMAREEYDKEVAARREAETKMDQLRTKFAEQALKLAAVDQEQRNAEALKRQSKELRSSVIGMEKHLSHLRAEVELSTAQMQELSGGGGDSNTAAGGGGSKDIERSLASRLEAVKETHRREIENLVAQRDGLLREITELRMTRDQFAEEANLLNQQNVALADQNAEASRRLDLHHHHHQQQQHSISSNSTTTRAASPHQYQIGRPHLDGGRPSHQHSNSSSSVTLLSQASSMSSNRSPISASRVAPSPMGPGGGGADVTELETPPRIVRVEHEPRFVAKKFGWGKGKQQQDLARPTHGATPSTSKALPPPRSNGVPEPIRTHVFQQTSILRPVRCEYCSDKMWGLNEVRCTSCGSYAHAKCAGYLQTPCTSSHSSHLANEDVTQTLGPTMFGNDLTTQVKIEERQVPVVVSKCISAVEAYAGMNYEGIYRKTGGSGQTKLITACFERGQDFNLEDLDKFNDLAAITSCMKNYFRSLPDPLFTHDRHETFVACAEMPEGEGRLIALEQAIYTLPEAHFHTARMLIAHLHRIHLRSNENKMTPANLGVVFGPTVLRSRLASREFSDMGFKAKLVEIMVEHQPRLFAKSYTPPPENGSLNQ